MDLGILTKDLEDKRWILSSSLFLSRFQKILKFFKSKSLFVSAAESVELLQNLRIRVKGREREEGERSEGREWEEGDRG